MALIIPGVIVAGAAVGVVVTFFAGAGAGALVANKMTGDSKAENIELRGELAQSVAKLSLMPKRLERISGQQSEEEAELVLFRHRLLAQADQIKQISENVFFLDYPAMLTDLADTTKLYYKNSACLDDFLASVMGVIGKVLLTQKILLEDYEKVVVQNIELRNKIQEWTRGVDFTQASVQELARQCRHRQESTIPTEDVHRMIIEIDKIMATIGNLAQKQEACVNQRLLRC